MTLLPLAVITNFWASLAMTAFYAVFGVVLMALGFWLFDKLTPGNLHEEIIEKKNVAAGILAAGVMIALGIIIHASFQ